MKDLKEQAKNDPAKAEELKALMQPKKKKKEESNSDEAPAENNMLKAMSDFFEIFPQIIPAKEFYEKVTI